MKKTKIFAVLTLVATLVLSAGCKATDTKTENGTDKPVVEKATGKSAEKFLVSYAYNNYHYSEILTMADAIFKAGEAGLEKLEYGVLDLKGENHTKEFITATKKFYDEENLYPMFSFLDEKGWLLVKLEDYEVHTFGDIVEAIFNVEFREEFVASYPDMNIGERHDTKSFIDANQKHYEDKKIDKIFDYVEKEDISFVGIRYFEPETPAETPETPETPDEGEDTETETPAEDVETPISDEAEEPTEGEEDTETP